MRISDWSSDVCSSDLVESQFVGGLRVTDKETAQIAEMVLAGSINKEIVGWISGAGGRAVGISGKDGGLVLCEKVLGKRRTEEHTSEHQSLMRISYAVFCVKQKNKGITAIHNRV